MRAPDGAVSFDCGAEIHDALEFQFTDGDTFEVRVLDSDDRVSHVGYFDSTSKATQTIAALDAPGARNIFVTVNPVKRALFARSANRMKEAGRYKRLSATTDADIERRKNILIDLDPVRPSGISATDAERKAVHAKAQDVRRFLRDHGCSESQIRDSGNGAGFLLPCDLPNDAASTMLVERFLAALDHHFSDAVVKIDKVVANAARVTRVPGTMNPKGDNIPERPHHRARNVVSPTQRTVTDASTIEKIAATDPVIEAPLRDGYSTRFDFDSFIAKHALEVRRQVPCGGGRKIELAQCPLVAAHGASYAPAFFETSRGFGFHCFGDRCAGKTLSDVRERLEPGYRDRREERRNVPAGSQTQNEPPKFVRVGDLLAQAEGDDIEYVVDGLLQMGGTSILAGRPKSGKSTWALNLALAVSRRQRFMGRATRQGAVLYVALEGARGGWKASIRKLEFRDDDDVRICIDRAPEAAMQWLKGACEEYKPALVIIDTMQRLLRVKDANDYAVGSNVTDSAIELARLVQAHLLLLHHSGKTRRSDIVDEVMGSTAYAAAVDTVMVLRKTERYRTLASQQRVGEELPETVLEFDPETLSVSVGGAKAEVDLAAMRVAIVDFLVDYAEAHRDDSAPTEAVIDEGVEGRTKLRRQALRELLTAVSLGSDGRKWQVYRTGEGGKKDPFKYSCSLVPD